jgi:hypothetical protein
MPSDTQIKPADTQASVALGRDKTIIDGSYKRPDYVAQAAT